MGIIEYHQGCGLDKGCMGSTDPYYTVFKTPLDFIQYPLKFALIPTIIVIIILLILKKKNLINWSNYILIAIPIITYLVFFIWLANWTWVVY